MDPTLAARALSAATEITSTALSGDDPEGVLETVVARAAELADADLGLAMVSADDGRVVVEAAYRLTGRGSGPTGKGSGRSGGSGGGAGGPGGRGAGGTAGRGDGGTGDLVGELDRGGERGDEPSGDQRPGGKDHGDHADDGGHGDLAGEGNRSDLEDDRDLADDGDGGDLEDGEDDRDPEDGGGHGDDGDRGDPGDLGKGGDLGEGGDGDDREGDRSDRGDRDDGGGDPSDRGDGTDLEDRTDLEDHGGPGPVGALRGLTLEAESAAGWVARGGAPVSAVDFLVDPRTAPYVPDELRGYGPFAAAPFGSGGRVLGALTVYRRQGREPFSAGTVEMLAAFAAQAGVVLALAEGANARHRVTLYQERERIARELHDVIVQRLYGTGMQLDRVRRNMRKRFAQADGARLSDAIDQLDQTIEEIRGTVRALRSPEPRHDPGTPTDLAESARGEVRIAGELLGYPPTLELSGEFADIPAERGDHIRAALREALSNVVRHSGASETRVSLTRDVEGVKLRVRDNGSGVPQGVATRGLRHLAERADAAGGRFYINSSPSLGTLVAFDLPLD